MYSFSLFAAALGTGAAVMKERDQDLCFRELLGPSVGGAPFRCFTQDCDVCPFFYAQLQSQLPGTLPPVPHSLRQN